MLGTNAPNQWEMTRSFALNVATGGTPGAERRARPADPARAAGPGGRAQRDRGHRHAGHPRRAPADLRARGPGRLDAAGARIVAHGTDLDGPGGRTDAPRPPGSTTWQRSTPATPKDPSGGLGDLLGQWATRHRADVLRPPGRLGGRPPVPTCPGSVPLGPSVGTVRRASPGHRQHRHLRRGLEPPRGGGAGLGVRPRAGLQRGADPTGGPRPDGGAAGWPWPPRRPPAQQDLVGRLGRSGGPTGHGRRAWISSRCRACSGTPRPCSATC